MTPVRMLSTAASLLLLSASARGQGFGQGNFRTGDFRTGAPDGYLGGPGGFRTGEWNSSATYNPATGVGSRANPYYRPFNPSPTVPPRVVDPFAPAAGASIFGPDYPAGTAEQPFVPRPGGVPESNPALMAPGEFWRTYAPQYPPRTTTSPQPGGKLSTDFALPPIALAKPTNHVTSYWPTGMMAYQGSLIRKNFTQYDRFQPGRPGVWSPPGMKPGYAFLSMYWPALAERLAIAGPGIDYNFGDDVLFQNDIVYIAGVRSGTTEQFAKQAIALAEAGRKDPAADARWFPLGVFALAVGTQPSASEIFQLSIDDDGLVRGNFYAAAADATTPVFGSLDKATQRVAWTVGKKSDRVFEAGLYNLTLDQTPILIHEGTTRTEQRLFVRIPPESAPLDR